MKSVILTMIYKASHRKLKIGEHEPHDNHGQFWILRNGKKFLCHMWHPSHHYYHQINEERTGLIPIKTHWFK